MDVAAAPHIPVLLDPILDLAAPVRGRWLDGTFGAGGYARGLIAAGAEEVIGVDRDPSVFRLAEGWRDDFPGQLTLKEGRFSQLDSLADGPLDGVVLDLGISSMQIDVAERGFSFQKDGPLDMRMSGEGPSAAEIVNEASEAELADILYLYGEERASRRIARAILAARPLATTLQLAQVIASVMPRQKPGQSHPATRSFQALRIAVNEEYDELFQGLAAAERALKPGGLLAVVTFHSIEDRMVKRFFAARSSTGGGSRHAPEVTGPEPTFEPVTKKAVEPDEGELAANPRARSARLRIGRRTDAPAVEMPQPRDLGMPVMRGHK
ncbi:16S rRNA (cytosine(1402)-N(4))-methyltransferase RsmH [Pseudoroseicyclus tamaricis]|uniref:Ribosomal RNA small subunit methyltransferase H n=1 Tax=Pseudoroseicyclus tamaricis TaxID=2705421 RepID=A0A6B2JQE8_9RHOB|nr:16S rRNA (cytosine(1402)-N(4))-methyltransferase RsmH [Pseudoroseicyclus tamaricis]NDV00358.1 16S rRNA (cytosine(1402)-N(4))-methyltransferase RsmH [Pseudoroseicyclus tamaricis]